MEYLNRMKTQDSREGAIQEFKYKEFEK